MLLSVRLACPGFAPRDRFVLAAVTVLVRCRSCLRPSQGDIYRLDDHDSAGDLTDGGGDESFGGGEGAGDRVSLLFTFSPSD